MNCSRCRANQELLDDISEYSGELRGEINDLKNENAELEAAIPRWISVEQPPEPCEAEEYEVWLDDPVDDGIISTHRMFAIYCMIPTRRKSVPAWVDRNENVLDVKHYRPLPAPPVV